MSIGAAASKPTLPLMPMMVSPTCMSLPIPYGEAMASILRIAAILSSNFSPFTEEISPWSKPISICSLPSLVICLR